MIPIGDSPRRTITPWVNYALVLVNIVVFVRMLGLETGFTGTTEEIRDAFDEQSATICYGFETAPTEADQFYCRWGFQPREFFDAAEGKEATQADRWNILFSLVSSMFVHAGLLHIAGNMLFLWVFGDNVEDRLGHIGYLLFYLVGGAIAALVQGAIDASSVVPVVGASGAVAAVLGSYLFFFPKATVTVVVPIFIILIPLPIPAVVMIGIWFLQNLLAGLAVIGNPASPSDGVAWFAHLGGFLFGAAATLFVFRPMIRKPTRYNVRR